VWTGPTRLGTRDPAVTFVELTQKGVVTGLDSGVYVWRPQSETWERVAAPSLVSPGSARVGYTTAADGALIAATVRGAPNTQSTVDVLRLNDNRWEPLTSMPVPQDVAPDRFTQPQPPIWSWAEAYQSSAGFYVRLGWRGNTSPTFFQDAQWLMYFAVPAVTGAPFGYGCFIAPRSCGGEELKVLRNGDLAYWSGGSFGAGAVLLSHAGRFDTIHLTPQTYGGQSVWSAYTHFVHTSGGDLLVKYGCPGRFAFCEAGVGVVWSDPITRLGVESAGEFPSAMTPDGSIAIVRDPATIASTSAGRWTIAYRLGRAEYSSPVPVPFDPTDIPAWVVDGGGDDQYAIALLPESVNPPPFKLIARKRR